MKYFLLSLILLSTYVSFAQVVTYNFAGTTGSQASQSASSHDANIVASSITRGSGLSANTGANSLNSNSWNSSAQDANDYYEFTLTPNASYSLTISSLTINLQRSTAGPPNYLITYKLGDGAETNLSNGTLSSTANTVLNPSITINSGLAVRFRIYAWGASSNLGTLRLNPNLTVNGAAPLPVKLISFTGQSADKVITLHWVTDSEDQNEGFDILKGQSPTSLEAVGFVTGHIDSQTQSTYTFTDTLVQPGTVYYYQLRQRDLGGNTQLSKMIDIRASVEPISTSYVAYPNPTQGSFYVAAQGKTLSSISLRNLLGREIPVRIQLDATTNAYFIQTLSPLPAGQYYLYLMSDNGSQQTLRVLAP